MAEWFPKFRASLVYIVPGQPMLYNEILSGKEESASWICWHMHLLPASGGWDKRAMCLRTTWQTNKIINKWINFVYTYLPCWGLNKELAHARPEIYLPWFSPFPASLPPPRGSLGLNWNSSSFCLSSARIKSPLCPASNFSFFFQSQGCSKHRARQVLCYWAIPSSVPQTLLSGNKSPVQHSGRAWWEGPNNLWNSSERKISLFSLDCLCIQSFLSVWT